MRLTYWILTVLLCAIGAFGVFYFVKSADNRAASMEPSSSESVTSNTPAPQTPAVIDNLTAPKTKKQGSVAGEALTTSTGLPVSPICFEQLSASEKTPAQTDITTCETDFGSKIVGTVTGQGFVQSRYEIEGEDGETGSKDLGIIMYRVVGHVNDGAVIETRSFTGGTGRFSHVFVVSLDGTVLKSVRDIAGGDRCNGGVTDVKMSDDKVLISMNVTPGDFTTLATGSDQNIQPYEDLEASAASCFATAVIDETGTLQSVTFDPKAIEDRDTDWTSQYKLQSCFDDLFRKNITDKKLQLNKLEFELWVQNFLKVCRKQ